MGQSTACTKVNLAKAIKEKAVVACYATVLACSAAAAPFDMTPLACKELPAPLPGSPIYEKIKSILDTALPGMGGSGILSEQNVILVSECDTIAVIRIIPGKIGKDKRNRIGTMATIVFGKSQWVNWLESKYRVFLY